MDIHYVLVGPEDQQLQVDPSYPKKKGPFDLVGMTSDKHKLIFILVFFN